MKKILTVLLFAICFACAVGLFAACSGTEKVLEGEYETNYHKVFSDECDDFMTIDGKLEEEAWQNKKYLTNVCAVPELNNDATVHYTVHMTEKGLYVGSYVDDTTFFYNRMYSDSNSNWKIYISPVGQKTNNQAFVKTFQIDYKSIRSAQGARVSSAVYVDGEVNSGNTRGASMEMFVTWAELNIDVTAYEKGYPDQISMYATYKVILDSTGSSARVLSTAFTSTSKPSMYYLFDNGGYLNADGEGAVLGDAPTGYAKTNGWDISGLSQGQAESVSDNVQIIWFRDAYSARWAAEVKISPVDDIEDSGPKVGMIALRDTNNFRAFLLNAADGNLTESEGVRNFDRCHMFGLTYYPSYTWTMSALGVDSSVDMDAYQDGCMMKVVKDGAKMYYFINDTFVYSEECPYIDGSVYVGLVSIGFDAVFSDYVFTDYADDEAGLGAELEGMVRLSVVNGVGGTAQTEKIAAKEGTDVVLALNVWQGYEIQSVSANGKDITQTLRENAGGNNLYLTDGSCTIEGITEDTLFEVEYKPLSSQKQITLSIQDGEGKALSGRAILYSETDPLLRYETSVGVSGTRCILPDDRGSLKVLAVTGDSGTVISDLDMEKDSYVLTIGEPLVGGDYTFGEYSVVSGRTGWDYLFQSEGTVYADNGANGTYAYFGGHFDDTAVLKLTIRKSVSVEEWLFAGIVMSNADKRVEIGVQGQKLRYYNGSSSDYTDREGVFSASLFGTAEKEISLTFVRNDGKLYIYERTDGTETLVCQMEDLLVGDAAYGLTLRANNTVNVSFTDLSLMTGTQAEEEIEENYTPGFFGAVSSGVNVDENSKTAVLPSASTGAYAYFSETTKSPHYAVVETTISGENTLWATVGFTMKSETDEAYFGLYANRFKAVLNGEVTYEGTSAVFDARAHQPMQNVKIKMFRSGERIYLCEDSGSGYSVKLQMDFSEMFADLYTSGMFGGETYYGVGVRGTNAAMTFSSVRFVTGDAASAEIEEGTKQKFFGTVSENAVVSEQDRSVTLPAISSGYAFAEFFAADGEGKAVVSFTVNYSGNGWPVIGFTMSDEAGNKVYMGMYATRLRTELNGSGTDSTKEHSGVFKADTRNGLTNVQLMMIRSGNSVTILEMIDGTWTVKKTAAFADLFGAAYQEGMFVGNTKYGVGVRATNADTVFTSVVYKTGAEAQSVIDLYLSSAN